MTASPPFRHVECLAPKVETERRPDGMIVLRSGYPLGEIEPSVCVYLRRWAREALDRQYLVQRDASGEWRPITYGEMNAGANAVGQALLDRGLGTGRPAMLLSGNSLAHATLTFGAMTVGVTAVPVSPAYSLMSRDFAKLKFVFDLIRPAMVFVQNAHCSGRKRRGFCPSCGARRMAESAALLVDEAIPQVQVRQWVLSFPTGLRILFAARPEPFTAVLRKESTAWSNVSSYTLIHVLHSFMCSLPRSKNGNRKLHRFR